MPRVKEQTGTYAAKALSRKTRKRREFVLDDKGKRIGVILDLNSYEKLIDAQEDLEDIRAFDEAKAKADEDFAAGRFVTPAEYSRKRRIRKR